MRDQREKIPDTISIFSENMYLEKKMTKVFVYKNMHDDVSLKEVFPINDDCFIGTLYTCKSCFCLLMEI